jgi:hypothetical protein
LVAMFSDRHNPFNPLASSVGQLDGPLATKSFPFPGWFRRVPGLGTTAAGFVDMGNLLAPTDPDHLYHWRPNDRLEDNVVDLDDLARMLVGGPLGFLEGWFSALLVFEIFLAVMGARDGTLGPIRHERSARQKPMVHVLADERSAIPTLLRTLGALPADAVMLPDYQHVDTATAAAERPDRGHEPAAAAISDFVVREVGR